MRGGQGRSLSITLNGTVVEGSSPTGIMTVSPRLVARNSLPIRRVTIIGIVRVAPFLDAIRVSSLVVL